MWPFKKKEIVPPVIKEKKPVKMRIAVSITMVNNRTDKEYVIKSNNDHGLIPKLVEKGTMRIRQRTEPPTDPNEDDGKNDSWVLIGSFNDFSMVATEWKEITIYV